MAWVPFLLFGIAVAAVYYFQIQRRVARRRAIATLARRVSFEYFQDDTAGITGMPFSFFQQGKGRKAQNVISGTHNKFPLKIFDYEYYIDSGRSRDYRRFTCAILTIPAACPSLRLSHETALTRLADHVGHHDIELEYDDFNRRFQVNGKDQKFAFSLLDGQMMQWLLDTDTFERVEIVGPWVMVVRKQLNPAVWLDLGTWLDAFQTRVPPVVYSTFPRA
jgi:hypothetical protein